jgi:hypothetical protein
MWRSIRAPNFAPVFRANVIRRLALLITRLSRLVLYIVLGLLVRLVLALPRVLEIPVPHGNTPLLRLVQTSSQYPYVRVVQDVSPSLRLLSSAVTRGQSVCRVLPRGAIAWAQMAVFILLPLREVPLLPPMAL